MNSQINIQSSQLQPFLLDSKNTVSREIILNHHLFYDLKLAAAVRGYDLVLYSPDVDRHGFDVIFDDGETIRKIQLKTVVLTEATTPKDRWDIHKTILRPSDELCERLGFEPSPTGTGVQGGIILMELTPKENHLDVVYKYCDIFVIYAISYGIVNKHKAIEANAESFYKSIRNGMAHQSICIPKSLFVTAKGGEQLLALMALQSRYDHCWWHHLVTIIEQDVYPDSKRDLPAPIEELRSIVADALVGLADDIQLP
jgi:hypothetical protein